MTLRFAVIGSPVAHSLSPAMHGAAYRALGLPHTYDKLETSAEELPARIAALRAGAFAGLNVTVPHKARALELVDAIDPSAAEAGAANTLVRSGAGEVRAYNTDAPALRDELVRLAGGAARFEGRSALVLGSGGAARAAIVALGRLGVARVVVRARTAKEALASVVEGVAASFEPLRAPRAEPPDLCAIVQATSAGMTHATAAGEIVADAVAWATVPADCVVYDVIYAPPRTPLLARATARGLAAAGGLGMLVGQGARAFELWLGVEAPIDVMRAALG